MKYIFVTIFLLSFFFVSCGSSADSEPVSKGDLFEIYVAVQVYGGKKAINVVKKFGLDKRENLLKYYEKLRTLSTNEEKWKDFLKRVDIERQKHSARRLNRNK